MKIRTFFLLTISLVLWGVAFSAYSAPYSGADITVDGSSYSAASNVSGGWTTDGTAIITHWGDEWVEYQANLTAGDWIVGINAINYADPGESGLGADPSWYPQFELSNNYTNAWVIVPASDTIENHGFFYLNVPSDGTYTIRFTWLNDRAEGDLDANIQINSVFFDQFTEPFAEISGTVYQSNGTTAVTDKTIQIDVAQGDPCGNHQRIANGMAFTP